MNEAPKKPARASASREGSRANASPEGARANVGLKGARANAGPKSESGGGRLTLRLVRSGICTPKDQKATIRGLGFRRLGQSVSREDSPAVRGMIRKVRHLVEVTKG